MFSFCFVCTFGWWLPVWFGCSSFSNFVFSLSSSPSSSSSPLLLRGDSCAYDCWRKCTRLRQEWVSECRTGVYPVNGRGLTVHRQGAILLLHTHALQSLPAAAHRRSRQEKEKLTMMSLDPLKTVISIGNIDDTSLAVPSLHQCRSGQQRVLEQVQTIRRTRSRPSSSSRIPSSPLSPTGERDTATSLVQFLQTRISYLLIN